MFDAEKIQLGISACVYGEKVRFDAGNKPSSYCLNELSKYVSFTPVCPEVAIGMPVPRPTVRQIAVGDTIKVCRPDGTGDVTEDMISYGQKMAGNLSHLSGYIFCAKSPSCGMERVKVYYEHGKGCRHDGVGLFAREMMKANPCMPVEENGRLNDANLRENFITRVYAYHRWLTLVDEGISKHKLMTFHAEHKYMLMSHDLVAYKKLGRLLAESEDSLEVLSQQYILTFMDALKQHATRKQHSNTLFHLQGYFKRNLSTEEKQLLTQCIDEYRVGLLPLMAPLTMIKHFLTLYPNDYLQTQKYLDPYPKTLRLRYGL